MDAFEFNKIAGAVLSALLVLFAIKTVFGIANETHGTAKPGYVIAMKAPPPTKPGKAVPAGFDAKAILAKLAGASAEDGAESFRRCLACHTTDKGGPRKVGPNLFGIVGRDVAGSAAFGYSPAMKGFGGKWTLERLVTYLNNPRSVVPGTRMAFAGIKDDQELADVVVYLNSLADTPAALPK